jgi:hypothetical protein
MQDREEKTEIDDQSERDDAEDRSSKDEDETDPGTKKGERPDNLRRRSEWFQKRTGGN